jgi:hypothetical protein
MERGWTGSEVIEIRAALLRLLTAANGHTADLARRLPTCPLSAQNKRYLAIDHSWCSEQTDYCNANQNFATNVGLHQRDVRPCGFLTGSMLPPGAALGSPVKTKQSSFDRLVS